MGDDQEARLKRELAECVMNSSWMFCCAGVALAVPIGVRYKTYAPIVYLGLGGTLIDLQNGYGKCLPRRKALEQYQASKNQ